MMQGIIDSGMVQKMQDGFANLAHICIYCVDGDGHGVTKVSGDRAESDRLLELIGNRRLIGLYDRLCSSTIEDQIIEDTEYANVKVAALAIRIDGKPVLCWLACCVLQPDESFIGGKIATGFEKLTDEDSFYQALDLIRMWMVQICQSSYSKNEAEAESRRNKFSQAEMRKALQKSECMTRIVQLLAGKGSFEELAYKVLAITQEYLNAGSIELFKLSRDHRTADIIAEYEPDDERHLFEKKRDLPRPIIITGDKNLVVSENTMISVPLRNYMDEMGIKAFISLPILIRGEINMYLCVHECRQERSWQVEEVKFLNDVAKILQSMLDQRISKNSMASSYQSIQEILNTVGSCIYVRDVERGQVLFANELLTHNFEQELKQGTLDELLDNAKPVGVKEGYYELHHEARRKWYDMHYTYINWVDGRKVAFCSLYDITDKKLYQRKIEQQAYTDFLTGLYNRMCCERDLAMQIDKTRTQGVKGGLLYLDLDDFKHINDGLGHQYGDVLLKSISSSLQRIEGIENSCYRMGGDEFVIIIPPESYDRFEDIVEGIKGIFAKPWFLKDADYYCTMSMGICEFPKDGEDVQDLIKKADIAMYEAKKSGKNRHSRYSDSISSISNKRLDMEKNMRNATSDGYKEFEVYYQPIIDIQKEGAPCTGAEALVRWNSTTFGFIPPSDFIPLAEYLGLINPIGNHVMFEACKACKSWNDNGHPEYKVNVNLSVVQLLQADIVDIVKDTLKKTQISPRNLTLEVTESLAINDMERMKEILNSIRELGVRIALDDFGTGYSSLNHIREIPLDVIKVDQSFVEDLTEDSYSQSFIKMVSELATAIGVSICIEGIETSEQCKVLEGMKVRLVQGYYFDRPMPRESFENKYCR